MKSKVQPKIKTDYLNGIYNNKMFVKMITQAAVVIKDFKKKHPFNAIAFTGTSGAAIAYPLSFLLKVPLICVRKSSKDNHYGSLVEGYTSAKRYLIVDDFIETGRTIKKITQAIDRETDKQSKLVGIFLYNGYRSSTYKDVPIIRL
jgi:adenine/guanine phosphoribosyltransferase-like PRPP-binding protein